ncbi:pyridoxamine 5'-phosphate oxidase family protein [Psychromonas sp. 14N.309.X.WAT.B.A12]|uniref:pyridoxamine 5'-phosphate oxidase family protein n=1 Tax=Psychromonas sp. 14N.309.X.WAT.B.A12 TaxID=2998322 RepID=UPI0025B1B17D|nr:pyridoxamine 5'-phosphate oxidase family protein [Psychromonas sp. 14N.309.X.WAT.B.A12]MDN2662519.1 pyridoxamine 5'-phosphate oxidase family protein [Psychromonas sp. 14N.309.X.WAT.B.A12]
MENSWHQGERLIQKRVGTEQRMADIGPKFIREFMPLQHREFFQSQTMIFMAYRDTTSIIQSSILFGEEGFISSPTETELWINTQNPMSDFRNNQINVGDRIGLLAIEFNTKRRNRVNAIITEINQKNIKVLVLQSYGNCPKYIQPKTLVSNAHYDPTSQLSSTIMTNNLRTLICQADSFFIASYFDDGEDNRSRGADISHRGGEAGFVRINNKGQLLVEDYLGNGFFNTLGNLLENPTASLLFCDWQQGHAIQIKVTCEILWPDTIQGQSNQKQSEAKRTLCFTPHKFTILSNSLAYRSQ